MLNFLREKEPEAELIVPVSVKDHPNVSECRKKLRWLVETPSNDVGKKMLITPDMARAMLERNHSDEWRNRPMSEKGLRRYVKAMRKGWCYTGSTITFSKNGRLCNGQHRLLACIEADTPFWCMVVFNVDNDAFKFEDTGIARTAGHIFAIEEIPNANFSAAVARLLYVYYADSQWDGRQSEIDNDTLLAFYEEHPRIQDCYSIARRLQKSRLMVGRWAGFCYYICQAKHREIAADFFDKMESGVGIMSTSSPVHVIRKRLELAASDDTKKLSDVHASAYVIKAWNAHRNGERIKNVRWKTEQSPNENFPRAI